MSILRPNALMDRLLPSIYRKEIPIIFWCILKEEVHVVATVSATLLKIAIKEVRSTWVAVFIFHKKILSRVSYQTIQTEISSQTGPKQSSCTVTEPSTKEIQKMLSDTKILNYISEEE